MQLAEDLNLKVAELDTLETGPLRKDTYELVMRRNLKTLVENLDLLPMQPKHTSGTHSW